MQISELVLVPRCHSGLPLGGSVAPLMCRLPGKVLIFQRDHPVTDKFFLSLKTPSEKSDLFKVWTEVGIHQSRQSLNTLSGVFDMFLICHRS